LSFRGFIDTDERAGLEIEIAIERNKAGVEGRFRDFTEYKDGTLYVSVLDHEYPGGLRRSGRR
jgi:hypothetical protein